MKTRLTIDFEDDERSELNMYVHAGDLQCAIDNAKNIIRNKLKHGQPEREPDEILEMIQEALYVEGVE